MKKNIRAATTTMLLVLALLGGGSFFANGMETNAVPHKMVVMTKGIILPEFKLDAVPFMEAVRQLSIASKQYDPAHKGVNYLVMNAPETNAYPKITLDLKNVTVAEATEQLATIAGFFVSAEDFAFVFNSRSFVPVHTDLQLAIDNPVRGEYAVNAYLKGTAFDASSPRTHICTMRDINGQVCSASIQYCGTENAKDYYLVTVTAPPGSIGAPAPTEIAYEGREIEVWKDSTWLIRMGPKAGHKQHAAASGS
jgi:hypothetical protein